MDIIYTQLHELFWKRMYFRNVLYTRMVFHSINIAWFTIYNNIMSLLKNDIGGFKMKYISITTLRIVQPNEEMKFT